MALTISHGSITGEGKPLELSDLWELVTQENLPDGMLNLVEKEIIGRLQQVNYYGGRPLARIPG